MNKIIATKIGHWPGTDVLCCELHAAKLKAVGQAMGFPVSFTDCGPEELCTNCQNEDKKTCSAENS